MAKCSFSKTIEVANGVTETFLASEFSSFDEAIKVVEKGIYDRELEKKQKEDSLKSNNTNGN